MAIKIDEQQKIFSTLHHSSDILINSLDTSSSQNKMDMFNQHLAQLKLLPIQDQISILLISTPLVSHQDKYHEYSKIILDHLNGLSSSFKSMKTVTMSTVYFREEADAFSKLILMHANNIEEIRLVHPGFLKNSDWVAADTKLQASDTHKQGKVSLTLPVLIEFVANVLTHDQLVRCNLFFRSEATPIMELLHLILERNHDMQSLNSIKAKNEMYNRYVIRINDKIAELHSDPQIKANSDNLPLITMKMHSAYSFRQLSSLFFHRHLRTNHQHVSVEEVNETHSPKLR